MRPDRLALARASLATTGGADHHVALERRLPPYGKLKTLVA
jgi:hypothetical protein